MPTYEYECTKCHHHFDAFQTMSSDVFKTCPEELCQMKSWGKGKVKRLLGAGAGFLFKGSGFYITDYRSEGYKSSSKSDASAGASGNVASETTKASSESKKTSTADTKTPPTPSKSVSEKKSSAPKSGKTRDK